MQVLGSVCSWVSRPLIEWILEYFSWLKLQPIAGLGKTENITGTDWESKVKGRTGIVMFDSYWTRDGELAADASDRHIDLWSGATNRAHGTRPDARKGSPTSLHPPHVIQRPNCAARSMANCFSADVPVRRRM
jgi:hypothetical protein